MGTEGDMGMGPWSLFPLICFLTQVSSLALTLPPRCAALPTPRLNKLRDPEQKALKLRAQIILFFS